MSAQGTAQELRHRTLTHLQSWHAVVPPYLAEPEEVHPWLHADAVEPCDRDHSLDFLGLAPAESETP